MAMIDQMVAHARSRLDRVSAAEMATALGNGAVVVDIRPVELRQRDGEVPGAMIIDRNVLLWRLDPTSEHRSVDVGRDQQVIVFCDEGWASSLAAVELQRLGLRGATDLVGGYQAWKELQS